MFATLHKSILASLLLFALVGCKKDDPDVPTENLGPLAVKYFVPEAAAVGDTVTVLGLNFSPTPANNVVIFTTANSTAFSFRKGILYDSIKVVVPAQASTGPLTVKVHAQSATTQDPFVLVRGHWRRKADFPGGIGMDGTGFTIAGKTYQVLPGTNEMWAYDPATNRWARRAACPVGNVPLTSRTGELLSFTLNSFGYVGVYINQYPIDEIQFYRYDPAADTWSRIAAVPHIDAHHGTVFGLGNKGYLVDTDPYTKGVLEYDPQTNAWTRKGAFPGPGRYVSTSFSIGTKGYLGGGQTGGAGLLTDFWEYESTTDTWTRKADLPDTNYEPNGFTANNQGFMIGGSNAVYVYSQATNTWAREADFRGRTHTGKVSVGGGNYGYLSRGRGYGNDLYADFWQFSPN
jgi:N-acetylneuraminic acid mutarotase